MRKIGYLTAAALTALVTTAAMASPAAAANNVLTYGSNGGSAVAVGDKLIAGLKVVNGVVIPATFYSTTAGSTGVKCNVSNFEATVTSNPTAPGTATETVDVHNFSSCTTNVVGTTAVRGLTVLNLKYNASVTSGDVITITPRPGTDIKTRIVLGTFLGDITCEYVARNNTVTGTASDTDNSITFTDQPFDKVLGPSTCFSTAYLDAIYAPVLDDTVAGDPPVFVN